MKRLFFGLAALSMLFGVSSCKTETVESASDDRGDLTFRTILGKQTVRATEFGNGSWTDGNTLTVHAYPEGSTEEAYGDPVVITYDDAGDADPTTGTWAPTTPVTSHGTRVWYYAWFPNTIAAGTSGTPGSDTYAVDYTVAATSEAQEDFIATPQVVTSGFDVRLEFAHTLAEVNFGIVETFGMVIDIDPASIQLVDLYDKGTYTMGAQATAGPRWSALAKSTATPTYLYKPVTNSNVTDGQTNGVKYMGNTGSNPAAPVVAKNDNTNALMLMPQAFGDASTAALSFKFRLQYKDEDGTAVQVPAGGAYSDAVTVPLKDFDTATWAEGKRYLYLFDFSSYVATGEIKFTVVVNDWTDDDNNDVAETVIVADATLISIEAAIAGHSDANAATAGLLRFPIAVPTAISADMTLTIIPGFDAGDQIRLEFLDQTSADHFKMDINAAYWTRSGSGRFVTLTCVAPMPIAPELTATIPTEGDDPAEITAASFATGVQNAVAAQDAANTGNTAFTMFPIIVNEDFVSGQWTLTMPSETFESGDRVRIEFTGANGAGTVTEAAAAPEGWTVQKYGNVLLLIKS